MQPDRHAASRPTWAQALPRGLAPFALGLALAFTLQLVVVPAVGDFWARLLMDIGINITLAVSLNMVNGYTGQFSIGHAAFMAVGGYVAGAVTYYGSYLWLDALGPTGRPVVSGAFLGAGDLTFVAAALVGGLAAAGAGFVVGLPSLRLRGDYLAIVTLGFGEIFRVLVQRTDDVKFVAAEVAQAGPLELLTSVGGALGFGGIPTYTTVFWVWSVVAVVLVVATRLKFSSEGRAFLSVRENEVAAEAMGVDTTRYKVKAFVLAAFFAGLAGALFAHESGTTLNPRELGFQKSFDVVIMVVLGGMGSISGAVLAAILLTLLPELLRSFADWRMVAYAALLIGMMLARPQGLFGLREVWELGRPRRRAP